MTVSDKYMWIFFLRESFIHQNKHLQRVESKFSCFIAVFGFIISLSLKKNVKLKKKKKLIEKLKYCL